MKMALIAITTTMLTIGCASVNASRQVALEATEKQAKFDMDCEDLSVEPLTDFNPIGQHIGLINVGIKGCDQTATYEVECTNYSGFASGTKCRPRLNNIKQPK